jgi:hypothetical protein
MSGVCRLSEETASAAAGSRQDRSAELAVQEHSGGRLAGCRASGDPHSVASDDQGRDCQVVTRQLMEIAAGRTPSPPLVGL